MFDHTARVPFVASVFFVAFTLGSVPAFAQTRAQSPETPPLMYCPPAGPPPKCETCAQTPPKCAVSVCDMNCFSCSDIIDSARRCGVEIINARATPTQTPTPLPTDTPTVTPTPMPTNTPTATPTPQASCQYSEWGAWSDCDNQCGAGERRRQRSLLSSPAAGAGGCTQTQEEEACRSNSGCYVEGTIKFTWQGASMVLECPNGGSEVERSGFSGTQESCNFERFPKKRGGRWTCKAGNGTCLDQLPVVSSPRRRNGTSYQRSGTCDATVWIRCEED